MLNELPAGLPSTMELYTSEGQFGLDLKKTLQTYDTLTKNEKIKFIENWNLVISDSGEILKHSKTIDDLIDYGLITGKKSYEEHLEGIKQLKQLVEYLKTKL